MNPALLGLVISALAAAGGLLGVVLSGLGKRGDQRNQSVNDQFKRLMDEIAYWSSAAISARRELERCRAGLPPESSQKESPS